MTANENIDRMLRAIDEAHYLDDAVGWSNAIETAVCSLLRAKKQDNREATRRHGLYTMPDSSTWHSGTGEVTPPPNVNEDEWTEINRLHDMLRNARGIDKATMRALLTDVMERLAILIQERADRVPQPDARTRAWRGMVDDLIAPGTPTFDHHYEHRQLDGQWFVENVSSDGREIVAGPIMVEGTARAMAEERNRQRKPAL